MTTDSSAVGGFFNLSVPYGNWSVSFVKPVPIWQCATRALDFRLSLFPKCSRGPRSFSYLVVEPRRLWPHAWPTWACILKGCYHDALDDDHWSKAMTSSDDLLEAMDIMACAVGAHVICKYKYD